VYSQQYNKVVERHSTGFDIMKKLVQFDKKSHTEMSVARADKYLQRYGTCLADGLEFILKGALVDFSFNPFTYQQMLSIHQTTQRNISTDHYIQRRLQAFQTANRHCAQIIPGGLPANGRLVHLLSKSACVHSMHPGVRLEVVQTLKLLCKTKKVQALLMKDASLRESLVEHLEKCIMITLKLDSRHQSVAFDIVECASSILFPKKRSTLQTLHSYLPQPSKCIIECIMDRFPSMETLARYV